MRETARGVVALLLVFASFTTAMWLLAIVGAWWWG